MELRPWQIGRMDFVVPRIALILALSICGQASKIKAQQVLADERMNLVTFLSMANQASEGDSDVWSALAKTQLTFKSPSEHADFQFSFFIVPAQGSDPSKNGTYRCASVSNSEHRAQLFFGEYALPTVLFLDANCLTLGSRYDWHLRKNAKWAHVLDRDDILPIFQSKFAPKGSSGFLNFDFNSYLENLASAEQPPAYWHAATHTLTFRKKTGATIQLKFRSPNDADQFGTSLSSFMFTGSNGAILSWTNFIADRKNGFCLNLPSFEALLKVLQPIERHDGQQKSIVSQDASNTAESLKLWKTLLAFNHTDRRPKDSKSPLIEIRSQEVLLAFNAFVDEKVEYAKSNTLSPDEIPLFERKAIEIVAQLRNLKRFALLSISKEDQLAVVDDATMLWQGTEIATDPQLLNDTYKKLYSFYNFAPLSQEMKLELLEAIGSIGTPPVFSHQTRFQDDFFLSAIFHSYWQRELTNKEVVACLGGLGPKASEHISARVALETLVRGGVVDKIPADRLADWFEMTVVKGKPETQAEALRILTLVPQGQAYLLKYLEDAQAPAEAKAAVKKFLCYRAEATVKTKRFDFMSEDVCKKLLTP